MSLEIKTHLQNWRIYYMRQVKRFCTYRCMRDFMRRNHIR